MTPEDLTRLPLDRLRRLAESAPDAGLKQAAQKLLKDRTEPARAVERRAAVTVATTKYGTAQPELTLSWGDANYHRELRATLHDLAAQAERMLARTPEMWLVEIRYDDASTGAICIELMTGDAAEVERAVAVLRAICPGQDGKKKRGRKPGGKPAAAPAQAKPRANGTNGAAARA